MMSSRLHDACCFYLDLLHSHPVPPFLCHSTYDGLMPSSPEEQTVLLAADLRGVFEYMFGEAGDDIYTAYDPSKFPYAPYANASVAALTQANGDYNVRQVVHVPCRCLLWTV